MVSSFEEVDSKDSLLIAQGLEKYLNAKPVAQQAMLVISIPG
jgi:hypothetical protein